MKCIFHQKEPYSEISDEKYKELFGISPEIEKKQENALDRAWAARNFEIDKFWHRSAFFWGFIVLVLGAFGAVKTDTIKIDDSIPYPDLYLILLGGIVSVAWLMVIKGSKFWQENWEAHIDHLEDAVTGPLYKTVYTKGKGCFSVSRINESFAWIVIVMWGLLFLNFLMSCDLIQKIEKLFSPSWVEPIGIIMPTVVAIACIGVMIKYGRSSDGKYKIKTKKGVFVDRNS